MQTLSAGFHISIRKKKVTVAEALNIRLKEAQSILSKHTENYKIAPVMCVAFSPLYKATFVMAIFSSRLPRTIFLNRYRYLLGRGDNTLKAFMIKLDFRPLTTAHTRDGKNGKCTLSINPVSTDSFSSPPYSRIA